MKRGEIKEYPGMTLRCDGPYFDWPWWKRMLSTLLWRPYSILYALRGMAVFLLDTPPRYWSIDEPYVLNGQTWGGIPLFERWGLYRNIGEDRIRPIRWEVIRLAPDEVE